jgi:hypothetical protein
MAFAKGGHGKKRTKGICCHVLLCCCALLCLGFWGKNGYETALSGLNAASIK